MAAEVVVAATEVVRPKSRSGCESHGHFFEVLHVRDPKILIFREKSAKIRGNSVAQNLHCNSELVKEHLLKSEIISSRSAKIAMKFNKTC